MKRIYLVVGFALLSSVSFSQTVSPFTGDFSYSVDLLEVPSPDGPSIPVSISYSSGISPTQKASWIGLGWDYSPGSISRIVQGQPDDYNNIEVVKAGILTFNGQADVNQNGVEHVFGPFYFDQFPSSDNTSQGHYNVMDVYNMPKLIGSNEAIGSSVTLPDYDKYFVNSPGVVGQIKPFLFENGGLKQRDIVVQSNVNGFNLHASRADISTNNRQFTTKPEFILLNEFSEGNINTLDIVNQYIDFEPAKDAIYPPNGISNGWIQKFRGYGINTSGGVQHSVQEKNYRGTVIQYFTNAEIASGTALNKGFKDYPSVDRSSGDLIGGYTVTNPSGYSYHYALPVYVRDMLSATFPLDPNNNFVINNQLPLEFTEQKGVYATEWKLTAITGPDYVDLPPLNEVDENDLGYWVTYYYEGHQNLPFQSPEYGYQKMSADRDLSLYDGWSDKKKVTGSVSTFTQDVYYLDHIKTRSHTAYFERSERFDDINSDRNDGYSGEKLDYVFLVRNGSVPPNPSLAQLEENAVRSADLASGQDYRLQQGYYGNRHVNIGNTSAVAEEVIIIPSIASKVANLPSTVNHSPSDYQQVAVNLFSIYQEISALQNDRISIAYQGLPSSVTIASGQQENSGKLTLYSVQLRGKKMSTEIPSYDFQYGAGAKNANFDPRKIDFWGAYKSDYDPTNEYFKYTTNVSANDVDVWSLVSVEEPLGNTLSIEYESDVYDEVGYHFSPTRTYPIGNIQLQSPNIWTITFDKPVELQNAINKGRIWFEAETDIFGVGSAAFSGTFGVSGFNATGNTLTSTNDFNSNGLPNPQGDGINDFVRYAKRDKPGSITIPYTSLPSGGLRVKSLKNYNANGDFMTGTQYTYFDGKTRYEPAHFNKKDGIMIRSLSPLYSRLYGAPVVGYGKVEVRAIDHLGNSEGYVENLYNNYAWVERGSSRTFEELDCYITPLYLLRSGTVQSLGDNTSIYGKILETRVKNNQGHTMSYTRYEYEQLEDRKMYEIFYQEVVRDAPFAGIQVCTDALGYNPGGTDILLMSHNIYSYSPHVLTKVVTEQDGNVNLIENSGFDRYTGEPLVVRSVTNGNVKMAQSVPAYLRYPELGPKTLDMTHKNCLTAKSEQYAYSPEEGLDEVLSLNSKYMIGAAVTTWKNTWDVRRKVNSGYTFQSYSPGNAFFKPHETFVYQGLLGRHHNFIPFDFSGETDQEGFWRKTSATTKLDEQGHVLEARGAGGDAGTLKYGYDTRYPIVKADHAEYGELYYAGAEEGGRGNIFEGGVEGLSLISSQHAHSGTFSIAIPKQSRGFYVQPALKEGRIYRASVWVRQQNEHIANPMDQVQLRVTSANEPGNRGMGATLVSDFSIAKQAGEWYLLTVDFQRAAQLTQQGMTIEVFNGENYTIHADDFRVRPMSSTVESYVYEDATGLLLFRLDNDNFYQQYIYDDDGRLKFVVAEEEGAKPRRIEMERNYNYQKK